MERPFLITAVSQSWGQSHLLCFCALTFKAARNLPATTGPVPKLQLPTKMEQAPNPLQPDHTSFDASPVQGRERIWPLVLQHRVPKKLFYNHTIKQFASADLNHPSSGWHVSMCPQLPQRYQSGAPLTFRDLYIKGLPERFTDSRYLITETDN